MAERYSPKARERQRQHIRVLMQQDRDALFQHLDENANANRSAIMWAIDLTLWQFLKLKRGQYPYAPLQLGSYSWRFYMQMRRIQPKLCEEWRFCEKVRDLRNADRVELATKLADFLVDKGFHHIIEVDVAAVALLMIDPAELCGCEE